MHSQLQAALTYCQHSLQPIEWKGEKSLRSSNPRPDEEGIKTKGNGGVEPGARVQTHALMKKGLRRAPISPTFSSIRSNPRPDEEGIKTIIRS